MARIIKKKETDEPLIGLMRRLLRYSEGALGREQCTAAWEHAKQLTLETPWDPAGQTHQATLRAQGCVLVDVMVLINELLTRLFTQKAHAAGGDFDTQRIDAQCIRNNTDWAIEVMQDLCRNGWTADEFLFLMESHQRHGLARMRGGRGQSLVISLPPDLVHGGTTGSEGTR